MEKNYRIHTNITKDTVLNVNMQQDYDFLEVLSLKLRTSDAYRLHSSNYGVVIGRVLANDAFGIPNARVSVFVPRDRNDATYIESIYPYTEVMDRDRDGRRYNLLPDTSDDDCYRVVGTFPNKRLVLDDDVQLDIYDRYYKFSTVTNNAGDYMIFGLPSGNQQIHVDIDLSDIGILSQTPRDFLYKGYNITMFDSPRQFKESTNLENLAQLFSQNKSVYVYPFWGDSDLNNGIAAITRCDIQIQYKFEPTCVFMGSIISDNEGNSIGSRCDMAEDNGMNYQLIAGEGTIEMIRKTPDGLVEEFPIQGNQLIDSDGVWCYQIPMNLDYVGTDEYGNIIPTDNPSKGIPTRTQVRFRISKSETGNEGHSRHTAKYLVPMNPPLKRGNGVSSVLSGREVEDMYKFGSATPQSCFRDLYWNNVYSVKNYIPKSQVANRPYSPNYTALKGSNLATDQNPIPFNKLRIDLPFVYAVVCIIFDILINIIVVLNVVMSVLHWLMDEFCLKIPLFGGTLKICPFGGPFAWIFDAVGVDFTCISLGGGLSDDNTAFYPGCSKAAMEDSSCPDGMDGCEKSNNKAILRDRIQQKLAEDYKIVKLDFYQDWLNGALYMPLWYWRKSKKKKFLFFTIASAKNEYCDCNKGIYSRLKTYVTCNFKYANEDLGVNSGIMPPDEENWHRNKGRADKVYYANGLIKAVENDSGLKVYYYTPMNPTSNAGSTELSQLSDGFPSVILYATDIILLGNLNENNLYGIPQLFNNLPSTTANIPPIASRDDGSGDDSDQNSILNGLIQDVPNGLTITTGMDWLHDGNESVPSYKNGLFMDLNCTSVKTRAKSCVNVERLSELGMNLDMQFSTEYPSGGRLTQGTFMTDGFITKIELDDSENRAMFATLNHVGFMPQDYQEDIKDRGGDPFDTQILDESGYYIPKFKYLYPLDLDGRMQPSLDAYRNGFQQSMNDYRDLAYLDFRLGDKGNRHFYNGFSMPLYRNSFYFYFGVNKGNTAIEKFRKMFLADCFKNNKYPFSYTLETRPNSFCKKNYKNPSEGESYIKFTSNDIQQPYSLTLLDTNGQIVDGPREKLYTNEVLFQGETIVNGSYSLVITDANGRHTTARANLNMSQINFNYTSDALGTKYVKSKDDAEEQQQISFIIEQELCGEIEIDKIIIDEYEFTILNATVIDVTSNQISVDIFGKCNVNKSTGEEIFDFIDNIIANITITNNDDTTAENINGFFTGLDNVYNGDANKIIFKVVKPGTFNFKITEYCKGPKGEKVLSQENTSSLIISVANGQKFEAFINDVPTEILTNATNGLDIIANKDVITSEMMRRWVLVNDNEMYKKGWPQTVEGWNEYIALPINETNEFDPSNTYQIGEAAYYNNTLYKFIDNFSLKTFDPRETYFGGNVVTYGKEMYRFKEDPNASEFDPTHDYVSGNVVTYIYDDGTNISNKVYKFIKKFDIDEFNPLSGYTSGDDVSYEGKMYRFISDFKIDEFSLNSVYTINEIVSYNDKMYQFIKYFDIDEFNPLSGYTSGTVVSYNDEMYRLINNISLDTLYKDKKPVFNPKEEGYKIGEIVEYDNNVYEFINNVSLYRIYSDFTPTNKYIVNNVVSYNNKTYEFIKYFDIDEFNPIISGYTSGAVVSCGDEMYRLLTNINLYKNYVEFNPKTSYYKDDNVSYNKKAYKFESGLTINEFNADTGYTSGTVVGCDDEMYRLLSNVNLYKKEEKFSPKKEYNVNNKVSYDETVYEFISHFKIDEFNSLSGYTSGDVVSYGDEMYRLKNNINYYKRFNSFNPTTEYKSGSTVSYDETVYELPSGFTAIAQFNPSNNYDSDALVSDSGKMYCFSESGYTASTYEFKPTSTYYSGEVVVYNENLYIFISEHTGNWNSADVDETSLTNLVSDGTWSDFVSETKLSDERWKNTVNEIPSFIIDEFNPKDDYTSGDVATYNSKMYYFCDSGYTASAYTFDSASTYTSGDVVEYGGQLYIFTQDYISGTSQPSGAVTTNIEKLVNSGQCTFAIETVFSDTEIWSGTVVETTIDDGSWGDYVQEISSFNIDEFKPTNNYDSDTLVSDSGKMYIFSGSGYTASAYTFDSASTYTSGDVVVYTDEKLYVFLSGHTASPWSGTDARETSLTNLVSDGTWSNIASETKLSNTEKFGDIASVTTLDDNTVWSGTVREMSSFNIDEFDSASTYVIGDVVTYGGKMYVFISGHTGNWSGTTDARETNLSDTTVWSGTVVETTIDDGSWDNTVREVSSFNIYDFNSESAYTSGDVVVYTDEKMYVFTSNHQGPWSGGTDARETNLSDTTVWSGTVREISSFNIYKFNSTSSYYSGDVVLYNGKMYVFTSEHQGPWSGGTDARETSLSDAIVWSGTVVETTIDDGSWSGTVRETKLSDANVWYNIVRETKLYDDIWSNTVTEYPTFDVDEFNPSSGYTSGTVVSYGEKMYCLENNINYYKLFDSFNPTTEYKSGSTVSYDETVYELPSGFTAIAQFSPTNNYDSDALVSDSGKMYIFSESGYTASAYTFDSASAYTSGDVVVYTDEKLYVFLSGHTASPWSGTDVDETSLTNLVSDGTWSDFVFETKLSDERWESTVNEIPSFIIDEFNPSSDYISGDVVSYNGKMYCFSGSGYTASAYTFDSASTYTSGDVVRYGDDNIQYNLYEFTEYHVAYTPWSFDEVVITYLDELAVTNGGIWKFVGETKISDEEIWGDIVKETTISDDNWRDIVEKTVISSDTWNGYVVTADAKTYKNELSTAFDKVKILNYELSKICKLSNVVYDLDAGTNSFVLTVNGGKQPILYRSFSPSYGDESTDSNGDTIRYVESMFTYSDDNTIAIDVTYPNIVGHNYQDEGEGTPRLNRLFRSPNTDKVGNYLAAFTNNGGYITNYKVDSSAKVIHNPSNAPVNVENVKVLGEDVKYDHIPQTLINENNNSKYYRMMSVDRRQDFTLTVLGPIKEEFIEESNNFTSEEKVRLKGTRVFGNIINGIEMSYIEMEEGKSKNIISANTPSFDENVNDTYVSAVTENGTTYWIDSMWAIKNDRLEYTYSYPSGTTQLSSIELRLNGYSSGYSWTDYTDEMKIMCSGATTHKEDGEVDYSPINNGRIIPMYYDFRINGVDSRLMLWSSFNLGNLYNFCQNGDYNNLKWEPDDKNASITSKIPFYLDSYPSNTTNHIATGFYFDHYPTYRYIDALYKEYREKFSMSITSCKYEPMISVDNVGRLSAVLNSGKNTKFETSFKSEINVEGTARLVRPPSTHTYVRCCSSQPLDDYIKEIYNNWHNGLKAEGSTLNVSLIEEDSFNVLKKQYLGDGVVEDVVLDGNFTPISKTITYSLRSNNAEGYKYFVYLPKFFTMGEILTIKGGSYDMYNTNNLWDGAGTYGEVSVIRNGNVEQIGDVRKYDIDSEDQYYSSIRISQQLSPQDFSDNRLFVGVKKRFKPSIGNKEKHIKNEVVVYNCSDKISQSSENGLSGITITNLTRCGDHLNLTITIDWSQVAKATNNKIKYDNGVALEIMYRQTFNVGGIFIFNSTETRQIQESYYIMFKTNDLSPVREPYSDNPNFYVMTIGHEGNTYNYNVTICYKDPDSSLLISRCPSLIHFDVYFTSRECCYKIKQVDMSFASWDDFTAQVPKLDGCDYND